MKNLLKLFIIAVFTIISATAFSQPDLSKNPVKSGVIVDIRPDIILLKEDGSDIITPGQARPGAFVKFEAGDRVTYIIITHPDMFMLIKEIKIIGRAN